MLLDYKLWTTTGSERGKRLRHRLIFSAPLLALGISGLYVALAGEESPILSETGGFSPPASLVTIPLALPEPPKATAAALRA